MGVLQGGPEARLLLIALVNGFLYFAVSRGCIGQNMIALTMKVVFPFLCCKLCAMRFAADQPQNLGVTCDPGTGKGNSMGNDI